MLPTLSGSDEVTPFAPQPPPPPGARPYATLTTDRIANELLEETLLCLEQLTTGGTVMAINSTRNTEQSPRGRQLLGDLLALIQEAGKDLETYAPS